MLTAAKVGTEAGRSAPGAWCRTSQESRTSVQLISSVEVTNVDVLLSNINK